jgi:hypothetical protein
MMGAITSSGGLPEAARALARSNSPHVILGGFGGSLQVMTHFGVLFAPPLCALLQIIWQGLFLFKEGGV